MESQGISTQGDNIDSNDIVTPISEEAMFQNSDCSPVITNVETEKTNIPFLKREVDFGFDTSQMDTSCDQITENQTTSSSYSEQTFPEMNLEAIAENDLPQTQRKAKRSSTEAIAESIKKIESPKTTRKTRRTRSTPKFYDEYSDSFPVFLKIALQRSLRTRNQSKSRKLKKCKDCSFKTYLNSTLKKHNAEKHLTNIKNKGNK
ncbi:hypothetical protein Anas_06405 [Armadillidium nasatum]|uniref:Uncharacterized protein n=1 Tax=Armadillidium nasatum TaxID=96803 RepID=A0A5N5TNL2_9CRUS|nr:hypothetical protein Anas_06405 [Armadillidium nasatum]